VGAVWSSFPAYYRPPFFCFICYILYSSVSCVRRRSQGKVSGKHSADREPIPIYLFLADIELPVSQYTVLPFPPSALHPIFKFLLSLSSAHKPNELPSSVVSEVNLCPHLQQANSSDLKSFLSCYQKSLLTNHVRNTFSVSFRYLEKHTHPNIYARRKGVPMCFTASIGVSLRLCTVET